MTTPYSFLNKSNIIKLTAMQGALGGFLFFMKQAG